MSEERYTCNPVGATHHWHDVPSVLHNLEVCCRCGCVRVTLKKEREREAGNIGCFAELGTTDFIRVDPNLDKPDIVKQAREAIAEIRESLTEVQRGLQDQADKAGKAIRENRQDAVDALQGVKGRLDDVEASIGQIDASLTQQAADIAQGQAAIATNTAAIAQANTDMAALQNQMLTRTNQDRARLTTLEGQMAKVITKIGGIPL
jgi:DNA repair exonuclease SbcCD ATPase subunit